MYIPMKLRSCAILLFFVVSSFIFVNIICVQNICWHWTISYKTSERRIFYLTKRLPRQIDVRGRSKMALECGGRRGGVGARSRKVCLLSTHTINVAHCTVSLEIIVYCWSHFWTSLELPRPTLPLCPVKFRQLSNSSSSLSTEYLNVPYNKFLNFLWL